MHFATPFLVMLQLAMMAASRPSSLDPRDGRIVRLNWSNNITLEMPIVSVWDASSTILHAAACGNEVTLSDTKIRVEADHTGRGTIKIGLDTFNISSDRGESGGIICARMYNSVDVSIECEVPSPLTGSTQLPSITTTTLECASSFNLAHRILHLSAPDNLPVTDALDHFTNGIGPRKFLSVDPFL
ncbi:hypothetical protein GQ607_009117 [Colletotrichum asianum]|uniref:Uncharacterized protein n=1 Tax=Colletotrichum asianum TaxID=702518 RepID=A0A8H3W770_9PEZI|nr:hypothetical protein GQ607_009117 [Colletotrichum asianum]